MNKFVWVPPSRGRIAIMVTIKMAVAKYRQENPGWEQRALEKYYKRRVR